MTGGGSGLGAATARMLADAGARVALLDFNIDAAEKHAAAIGGLALRCDVADGASVETAFEAAIAVHGAPRILVNCAGIAPAQKIVSSKGTMPLDASSGPST